MNPARSPHEIGTLPIGRNSAHFARRRVVSDASIISNACRSTRLAPTGTTGEGEQKSARGDRPREEHGVRETVEIEQMAVRPVEKGERCAREDEIGREHGREQ